MMEAIAYASLAYLLMQLLIALANIITRPVLKDGIPSTRSKVSVLIPARNEAGNIGNLLDDLKDFGDQVTEILVYDDDSDDETAVVVEVKRLSDPRIRCIRGDGPHPGWLGKNFACDQLGREAKGDYLMFLDADVRVHPTILNDSLSFLEKHRLSLLSLFPVQIMKTPGEWLTIPHMNRILLGNLPLDLIRMVKLADLSAANGQFMLFKAAEYRKYWFHEQVRNEKVEDIRIMRMMKKSSLRTQTLLSNGQISCRMYRGLGDGISGFSKNVHAFFGKNWLILIIYVLLTVLGPFAAFYSFSFIIGLTYLAGLFLFVGITSYQSRQPVYLNTLLLLPQMITLLIITIMAAYRQLTGRLYWKGRKI